MAIGVSRVRGDNAIDTAGSAIGYVGKKFVGTHDFDPTSPGLDTRRADEERQLGLQSRGQQQELGNAIQDRALGRGGPSVAEQQLKRASAQNVMAARSAAASARGGNVALGNRMAMEGQQQALGQTAEQTAMLRAQEQIAAQQLASQHWASQRQQDLLARGYSIEEARATLDAEMKQQELRTQIAEGTANRGQNPAALVVGALGGAFASDRRAKEDIRTMYSDFTAKESIRPEASRPQFIRAQPPPIQPMQLQVSPAANDQNAAAAQLEQMKQDRIAQMTNAGSSKGDSMGDSALAGFQIGSMLSDYTAKEPTLADLDEAERRAVARVNEPVSPAESRRDLGPVKPVTYRYKPEASARMALETGQTPAERAMVYEDKRAPRPGIIAQDLEKSPAFAPAVVETPAGKAVDRDRALSEALAQLGGLDKRLREIEKTPYPTPRQPGEPEPEKPRPKARGGR